MTSPLKESLDRIVAWVTRKSPATLSGLNLPAGNSEIASLESKLKMTLPESFKDFLALHDGESGVNMLALLGDGNRLLSCKEILKQYKLDQQLGKAVHDPDLSKPAFWKDSASSQTIFLKGPVKPLLLHPKWIPITCMNGEVMRYIDLDPAPTGVPGQIIEVDVEGCSYEVLAESFEDLLSNHADQLEAGLFEVEESGNIFRDCGKDLMSWTVPGWLKRA